MRNLHRRFDGYYIGQIYNSGDFEKICGLLRIHELYEGELLLVKKYSNYFDKDGFRLDSLMTCYILFLPGFYFVKKFNCTGKVSRFSLLMESSEHNLLCLFDIIRSRNKEYLPSQ